MGYNVIQALVPVKHVLKNTEQHEVPQIGAAA